MAAAGVLSAGCFGQAPAPTLDSHAQVVVLGTGTPLADPERSGPAVAVVVNGAAYLVDCGPGVVRRAAAAEKAGIKALAVDKLKIVFITHLHSDHTLGYPDLIFSPWVLDRHEPLEAYGPRGLRRMTDHIEKAWSEDVKLRLGGLEEANSTGYKVNVHEIADTRAGAPAPHVVYRDANVTVSAFPVKHGTWKYAYGYRFDTKDRRIVISGDTAPTDEVVKACNGCDVLLHEVFNPKRKKIVENPTKQLYFRAFHTSPAELGELAARARPKLLVLYHQVMGETTEEDLVQQVREHYAGTFVSAKDLGVY
ncbi:MAG: MBL fold metallo-hydrolase [Acidobacteria bacterium]|nr:MBL fold metallo-hydrolase [Acidobacteriota bacterium]